MGGVFNAIFGGSQSKGQSQYTNTPVDMTPPAFAALQSPLASNLMGLFGGGPVYGGIGSAGLPLSTAPQVTTPSTFAAPLSANETALLGQIMNTGSQPGVLGNATNYIGQVLNPNFLNPNSNPMLQQAISGAVNPLISAYQNVTLPNLQSSFVANGQVLNGPAQVGPGASASGSGSSAFDKAAALAQTGLQQQIGQVTSNLLQQAMQQQGQAAAISPAVSQTSINNLITTLQAEALPRLIQQYGMDQGLQEFNNRMNVMLQALGLAGLKAGPYLANTGQGTSSNSSDSTRGILGGIGSLFGGGGLLG